MKYLTLLAVLFGCALYVGCSNSSTNTTTLTETELTNLSTINGSSLDIKN